MGRRVALSFTTQMYNFILYCANFLQTFCRKNFFFYMQYSRQNHPGTPGASNFNQNGLKRWYLSGYSLGNFNGIGLKCWLSTSYSTKWKKNWQMAFFNSVNVLNRSSQCRNCLIYSGVFTPKGYGGKRGTSSERGRCNPEKFFLTKSAQPFCDII